tara:strand:- start:454 stop:927 length:474 start_codon:yes stop_codon:yes gene_type:complete
LNTLDIIIASIILLFVLSAKYDGVYAQINKCLSLLISVFITKILLNQLIPILIPYLGLSEHIKAITFYLAISCFYLLNKFIINIILFRYEPSQKNKIIQSIGGVALGTINGILVVAFITSIIFYIFTINNELLLKLKSSMIFQFIYNLNSILFSYAK